MKILRSLACVALLAAPMTIKAITWESLALNFGAEFMHDHINGASEIALGWDKVKVGSLTIIDAGEAAEYAVTHFSTNKADRTATVLARLFTNTLWHLVEPGVEKFINNKDDWRRTELIIRTVAKVLIRELLLPYLPK